MKRSWSIWCVLLICAIAILGAMALMTRGVVRSEKDRLLAEAEARVNEQVGLALTRMDTIGAALLVTENQRPPLYYEAFFAPDDVFTSRLGSWGAGEHLVRASPLLVDRSELVTLHFQFQEEGAVISPQVPPAERQEFALKFVDSVDVLSQSQGLLANLNGFLSKEERRESLVGFCSSSTNWNSPTLEAVVTGNRVIANNFWFPVDNSQDQEVLNSANNYIEQSKRSEILKKEVSRSKAVTKKSPQSKNTKSIGKKVTVEPYRLPVIEGNSPEQVVRDELVMITPFQPAWLDGRLFLIRLVQGTRSNRYQAIWIDHEKLRDELVEQVPAGLPGIRLLPALVKKDDPLSLVSLPWRLEKDALSEIQLPAKSPVYQSLFLGWGAAFLSLLALFFLLRGVIRLSERRASFVSSVTHELRTPLTTFRLYSEMLAEGMVTDEEKKLDYLRTMSAESERLNHLVENVLSYSQIERGSARGQTEKLGVNDLIERIRPVLQRRMDQEDAAISIDIAEDLGSVETDVTAVEQILFNLVDNACKYGLSEGESGRISLSVKSVSKGFCFEVSDLGKGIASHERRRLFRAFHKSAQEAAHSKPGVGLGLALCRRLARALGGDLKLVKSPESSGSGACFQLMIPVA
ncbi:HAMP domain-containing histidine kinase [Akkermansiaceae bacterium]|nr:HAMP domain-containing histidine kinase [Akkermansiaceae bacterium]